MARLRLRPVRPDTARSIAHRDESLNEGLPEVASDDTSPVTAISTKPRNPHRKHVRNDEPEVELPLDMAIEALLATDGIDAVSQIRLDEMRRDLLATDAQYLLSLLYGQNIQSHLMHFLMPRLRHPDVLRSASSHSILEYLLIAAGDSADEATLEGRNIIQTELNRMELLRQNRNTMIEG